MQKSTWQINILRQPTNIITLLKSHTGNLDRLISRTVCLTERKMRNLWGKISTGSSTIVMITDVHGNTVDLTNKADVERAIITNIKSKYKPSFHTLFLQPPLVRDFGFQGLTQPLSRLWLAAIRRMHLSIHMKPGASSAMIAELECKLNNIPICSGYVPTHWKKCTVVMILKKSGNTLLSVLCTIVLFPVDCLNNIVATSVIEP